MTLSPLRRLWLRACYLLLAAGLAATALLPALQGHHQAPLMDGIVNSLLAALGLLAIIGLAAPVRMLPLLVFEVVWKTLWVLSVAVPRWATGDFDADIGATLFACAFALPFVFIIPWRRWGEHLRAAEAPAGPGTGSDT